MNLDELEDEFLAFVDKMDLEDNIVILFDHRNKIYLKSTCQKMKTASILMKYINRDVELQVIIKRFINELNKQTSKQTNNRIDERENNLYPF